ncbi:hypothetical protein Z028_05790 [Mycobacterium tuberculosis INS_MDR]|nr:hypothetical protein Z028_05790 [Mycobacterium tuberculosis INS_MDR]
MSTHLTFQIPKLIIEARGIAAHPDLTSKT